MKVKIDLGPYRDAHHGESPRGNGIWLFSLGPGLSLTHYGTYRGGRRRAIRYANEQNVSIITLLPGSGRSGRRLGTK